MLRRGSGYGFQGEGLQRDLLPLPVGAGLDAALLGAGGALLTARQQRRAAARAHPQRQWLHEGVAALNEMANPGKVPAPPRAAAPAQTLALTHLADLYRDVGDPPSDLDPARAWHMLRLTRSGYSEEDADGSTAYFRRGAVALPRAGAGNVQLADCLSPAVQHLMSEGSELCATAPELEAALGTAPAEPAMDPILKCGSFDYGFFVGQLLDHGVAEVSNDTAERTGLFCVRKRTGPSA